MRLSYEGRDRTCSEKDSLGMGRLRLLEDDQGINIVALRDICYGTRPSYDGFLYDISCKGTSIVSACYRKGGQCTLQRIA